MSKTEAAIRLFMDTIALADDVVINAKYLNQHILFLEDPEATDYILRILRAAFEIKKQYKRILEDPKNERAKLDYTLRELLADVELGASDD